MRQPPPRNSENLISTQHAQISSDNNNNIIITITIKITHMFLSLNSTLSNVFSESGLSVNTKFVDIFIHILVKQVAIFFFL